MLLNGKVEAKGAIVICKNASMELGHRRGCPKTEEPVGNIYFILFYLMVNGSMLMLYYYSYYIVWFL